MPHYCYAVVLTPVQRSRMSYKLSTASAKRFELSIVWKINEPSIMKNCLVNGNIGAQAQVRILSEMSLLELQKQQKL